MNEEKKKTNGLGYSIGKKLEEFGKWLTDFESEKKLMKDVGETGRRLTSSKKSDEEDGNE